MLGWELEGLGAHSFAEAAAALAVANAAAKETGGVLEAASHLVLLAPPCVM